MDILQAVVLALVQAFTEFLPISSSAHLILIRWLLGWQDPGLFFDVALHFGTLLALAAYFARTWVRIIGLAVGREVLRPDAGIPILSSTRILACCGIWRQRRCRRGWPGCSGRI